MQFDKISDKLLYCRLDKKDIEKMGFNINSITYGSPETNNLFQEILEIANKKTGFDYKNDSIKIDVTVIEDTLGDKSLSLYISKNENNEGLDPLFSIFSSYKKENPDINFEKKEAKEDKYNTILINEVEKLDKINKFFIFKSLDDLIDASNSIADAYIGESVVYKNPANNSYYLLVTNDLCSPHLFNYCLTSLSEYGDILNMPPFSKEHFDEHFETFIPCKAINKLAKIK